MGSKVIGYYDYNDREQLFCPSCQWKGTGEEVEPEVRRDALDIECPRCGTLILIILYPTLDQTREAAGKGNEKALRELRGAEEAERKHKDFEERKLKGPEQLPDLSEDGLEFVWDQEGDQTLIRYGEMVIWKEPVRFEGLERFNEVKEFLKRKYGERFRSLKPSERSELHLYGDDLSAPDRISFF